MRANKLADILHMGDNDLCHDVTSIASNDPSVSLTTTANPHGALATDTLGPLATDTLENPSVSSFDSTKVTAPDSVKSNDSFYDTEIDKRIQNALIESLLREEGNDHFFLLFKISGLL